MLGVGVWGVFGNSDRGDSVFIEYTEQSGDEFRPERRGEIDAIPKPANLCRKPAKWIKGRKVSDFKGKYLKEHQKA